jgi:hypothetical protein
MRLRIHTLRLSKQPALFLHTQVALQTNTHKHTHTYPPARREPYWPAQLLFAPTALVRAGLEHLATRTLGACACESSCVCGLHTSFIREAHTHTHTRTHTVLPSCCNSGKPARVAASQNASGACVLKSRSCSSWASVCGAVCKVYFGVNKCVSTYDIHTRTRANSYTAPTSTQYADRVNLEACTQESYSLHAEAQSSTHASCVRECMRDRAAFSPCEVFQA